MADTRRINANIREEDEKRPAEEQPPFGVYAVILSSEFWPPFKDEKLEVPEDIREALEVYCRKYEKLKVGLRCWGRGRLARVLRLLWDPRSLRSPWSPRVRTCRLCVHALHALLCPTVLAQVLTLGCLRSVRLFSEPGLVAVLGPGPAVSPGGCLQGVSWLLLGCLAAPLGLL